MIRVLVVDDRIDFRLAFCGLLEGQPDLKVVGQAGSLAEARTMLEGVDVALIDRGLPDGDGLDLMGPLREVNPCARVFVISSTAEMLRPKDGRCSILGCDRSGSGGGDRQAGSPRAGVRGDTG
jgi:DNA-binding NarL/FixJ family response regulator